MPESIRSLPPNPSLEQQKKLARELLRGFRAGDAEARERIRRHLPDRKRIALADAQFVLAREYGFESWPKLKAHIEAAVAPAIPQALREEFRRAFAKRDAASVRDLLRRHPAARALIDAPLFPFDAPALVHFASEGDLPLVGVLLDFGADPNRRSRWWAGGWHALHSARGAVAEKLLDAGAVPDACAAANLDRPDLLRRMLDEDPRRVHERGGDGQTPLHFARSRAVVDLLLERGADPDARDRDHRGTPAQWMLERRRGAGRYDLAAHLVERGATADIFLATALGLTERLRALLDSDPALLALRTGQGEYGEQPPSSLHIYTWSIGQNLSPLQVAERFDQPEAARVLRELGGHKELFLAACAGGRAAEARRILGERPGLVAELSAHEQRALPDAAWAGDAAAVELMLELGFDPATPGQDGGTVLHCAAWQGSLPALRAALREPRVRALINQRDAVHGSTPLGWCCHGACHSGNARGAYPAVARQLLEAGAVPEPGVEDGAPADVAAVVGEFRR